MRNQLTRIEVSIQADWHSSESEFKRALTARLAGLVAELAETHKVTPTRIQMIANPKGGKKA